MSTTPPPPPTPTAPQPDRADRPSSVGRIVLGLVLVLAGLAWLLETTDAADVPWGSILPGALLVVGVAVLATARRPSGGLIFTGIVLSVLVLVSGLMTFPLDGQVSGAGDVDRRPTSLAEAEDGFALIVGSLTVDLRDVDGSLAGTTVEAGVGIGELVVLLPTDVAVHVRARAGIGEVVVEGRSSGGFGAEISDTIGDGADGTLTLDVSSGIGKVEVRR